MVRLNRTYYSLQKVQISRLKHGTASLYTLFAFKFTGKIFHKLSHQVKIPANYADSAQFAHTVCELRETCTFC